MDAKTVKRNFEENSNNIEEKSQKNPQKIKTEKKKKKEKVENFENGKMIFSRYRQF